MISEKVIPLFGKKYEDPSVSELLTEFNGEIRSLNSEASEGKRFSVDLKDSGVRLTFGKEDEGLVAVAFLTESKENGAASFSDEVLGGVSLDDAREIVRQKIGQPLSTEISQDMTWDIFRHDELFLRVEYNKPTDAIQAITLSKTRPARESRFGSQSADK